MKLDEIKQLPHIIIKEITDKYTHIDTETGYKMTFWNEADPIEEYNSFSCIHLPFFEDYPAYRIVSDEEDNLLIDKQEQAMKDKNEKPV